jgi:hypothetical protein
VHLHLSKVGKRLPAPAFSFEGDFFSMAPVPEFASMLADRAFAESTELSVLILKHM